MSRISEAVREIAEPVRLREHRLVDALADEHGRDRLHGGGEGLGRGDHVGAQRIGLRAPHFSGAGKAANHLVGHEENVVLAQQRLHLLEIALRRNDCAAGAHDRLGEEGGDGVRAFRLDERLERLGHARGELIFRLARLMPAVVVGKFGVLEGGERQTEAGVHVRLSRQADRGAGAAVTGHLPGDDLCSPRFPGGIPIIPGEFYCGVVRLRARALEDDAGHGPGRNLEQRLGERDGGLVRAMAIKMVVAERAHLLGGDLRKPLGAKSERRAPESRDRVDVIASGIVEDSTTPATRNDVRAFFLVLAQIGLHMHQGCDIARLDRVRNVAHAQSSDASRSACGSATP